MKTLIIIHFSPLELYPPVQNLLTEIKRRCPAGRVIVLTTHSSVLDPFIIDNETITLVRLGRSGNNLNALLRYWGYLRFYFMCLLKIIQYRPFNILYFETLSSFPAYLYKRFFRSDCNVYIHYHEYTSPQEYETGMRLSKYFHSLERWLYPRASWISHTNKLRMEKFNNDIKPIVPPNEFIMPNYPPREWITEPKLILNFPIKIVYAGALSMSTMYTMEFAQWVHSHKGKIYWDIYSYNYEQGAANYLKSMASPYISLKRGVNYHELPDILSRYDVGVVLYKGHTENYIFNAPNKLFEYFSCGLTVLFPRIMTGSLPYRTENSYPEIKAVDFTALDKITPESLLTPAGHRPLASHFSSENALKPLFEKLDI